jgi:hypothetical protein
MLEAIFEIVAKLDAAGELTAENLARAVNRTFGIYVEADEIRRLL